MDCLHADEMHEQCSSCGHVFVMSRSSGAELRQSAPRCTDCFANATTNTAQTVTTHAPATDAFSIHSLVGVRRGGDISHAVNKSRQRPPAIRNAAADATSSSSSFLVQAAAAHAQYYALAASGLLPAALHYGGRSTGVAAGQSSGPWPCRFQT